MCLSATAVSIIYGFFMVGAGARFVGPLGISIIWALYHAIAPWLLIFYSLLPFRHEVEKKVVLYNVGRSIFFVIVNLCFAFSYVCFVACIVLAYKTKDLSSYNSGYNNGVYHLGVIFQCMTKLKHKLSLYLGVMPADRYMIGSLQMEH